MIPFSEQLTQIRNGDLDDELTEALADCVKAVDQQGGSATLTIKITVKRSGTNSGYVKVSGSYSTKLPKQDPIESILFATQDGALWEDNPKQARMFDQAPAQIERHERPSVRIVPLKADDPVIVDKETGEIVEVTANQRN